MVPCGRADQAFQITLFSFQPFLVYVSAYLQGQVVDGGHADFFSGFTFSMLPVVYRGTSA
jgi:hypothetical protein